MPGAHILSGNVLEPRALEELFPEWSTNEELADIPVKVSCFDCSPNAPWYMLHLFSNIMAGREVQNG